MRSFRRYGIACGAFVAALVAAAAVPLGQGVSTIHVDGSSTVFPISEAVAEEFQILKNNVVRVTVGISGTGGGFKKFCRGETAVANASRPILTKEMEACRTAGIQYIELPIAYDALTIVVHRQNAWLTKITVEELKKMWEPAAQSTVKKWSDVNPAWPNEPFALFGPGADSGTFDYFTEAIVGKAKSSRGDYAASEDDNMLVMSVARNRNALGYFGYAYYAAHTNQLRAVPVVNPHGVAVEPSIEAVISGTYQPLSRPIFIYVSVKALKRPEVVEFTQFYLAKAAELAREVKYIPLPEAAYRLGEQRLNERKAGTVFGGRLEVGVRIEDLIMREGTH